MGSREKPDHYTKQAKKEGYPARSVYKLEEIQQKTRLVKPGDHVLDVGAAPGSWSLYLLRFLKGKGMVVGADLKPITLKPVPNLKFIQGDVFKEETLRFLAEHGPYQVVVSDAAPSTTGNRTVDTARSLGLTEQILGLADRLLVKGGNFAIKIFQGGDEKQLIDQMRTRFDRTKILKPKAVRKDSFETYFIGLGKKESCDEDLYGRTES